MKTLRNLLSVFIVLLIGCSERSDTTNAVVESQSLEEQRRAELERMVDAYFKALEEYRVHVPDEAYNQLVKELAQQNEYALEFLELYPQAFQLSSRTFMRAGPIGKLAGNGKPWDFLAFSAPLYGRYQFRCYIPFYLSTDYQRVEQFGDPHYDLWATTRFDRNPDGGVNTSGKHINLPGDMYRYELDDWLWFNKYDRDWAKIGVPLRMDAPWPGYDDYCRQNMIR